MKCLVSGSTGLVGTALVSHLKKTGHSVHRLVRKPASSADEIYWQPETGIDQSKLEGFEAVIHLAGESIMGRWTAGKKEAIRKSRIDGTRILSDALGALKTPLRVMVCASAIGYYGDRGNELLREDSPAGTGFLSEVCQAWEQAAASLAEKGPRVCSTRFGIILSNHGGALKQMLTPFKLGVGGKIGSGNQYYSWISLDDVAQAIHHVLMNESIQGPVNFVSPNPVTNAEFTRILAKVLNRPAIFPVPTPAAKLAFGEMADALLLASARVEPSKLLASNYPYQYPELEGAFRHALKR
jgi:uncharacterized protein (TIGR01777 family)